MEKQKRSYSGEFKIKALELGNHRGNLQAVAMELDENIKPTIPKSVEQLENIALGKALRDAGLEGDIPKKVLGIFFRSGR